MVASSSRLVSGRSTTNGSLSPSFTASTSDRSISLSKTTLPGVVRRTSSPRRNSMGDCSETFSCFASSANSTCSSLVNRGSPFSPSCLASSSEVTAVRSCSQYVR